MHDTAPVLLPHPLSMRFVWLVPFTFVVVGIGAYLRGRRRRGGSASLTTEAVSGQWLAQARGREEHPW
jgi:hypothetical protein